MGKRRLRVCFLVAFLIAFVVLQPLSAYADTKYWVDANNTSIHYGCEGYVYVPLAPTVTYIKVASIFASTKGQPYTSLAEIGHVWESAEGFSPWAFYWITHKGIDDGPHFVAWLTAGDSPRYHTGYNYSGYGGNHDWYFWYNNSVEYHGYIDGLTSCWPGTNAEKHEFVTDDNSADFTGLMYKNQAWGSWSNWSGAEEWADNDPNYKNQFDSSTHVESVAQ